jgi:hypothetical protein
MFFTFLVGKMELFSPTFFPAVTAALDGGAALVLGTLPTPRMGQTIPQASFSCRWWLGCLAGGAAPHSQSAM